MLLSIFLFENSLVNIVAITFTALILAQLLNVAFEIHTWNRFIFASEVVAFITYFTSMFLLSNYFGKSSYATQYFDLAISRYSLSSDLGFLMEGYHCDTCKLSASLFGKENQTKI